MVYWFYFSSFFAEIFDVGFFPLIFDQRKKPTKSKIKKSQRQMMKGKTIIPSPKYFSVLNPILRSILPHRRRFSVNFNLFVPHFLLFLEIGVFCSEKSVRDREKLISFLDSAEKIGSETYAHCPETFGTQNFVDLCY